MQIKNVQMFLGRFENQQASACGWKHLYFGNLPLVGRFVSEEIGA